MRVHQICARLQYGDAVTGQVLAMHRAMTSWGWESHVYASSHDEAMAKHNEGLEAYRRYIRNRGDVLIYHYSIFDENYRFFLKSKNRKIFYYHNITPPHFFAPFEPFLAEMCQRGRELLPRLNECDLALGVSEFNRRELVEAGFEEHKTGVLALILDLNRLQGRYSHGVFKALQDGKTNVLFVGRLVPNKRIEDLIDLYAGYHHGVNVRSRLLLVGATWSLAYNRELALRIRGRGIQRSVVIPGWSWGVTDEDLMAFYRAAHLFVTCSEHEGFCAPLLESMFFGVPVLAREAAAVPWTLGDAGVLFRDFDIPLLAEIMEELAFNSGLREALQRKMKERLREFHPDAVARKLREFVENLVAKD